MEFIIVDGKRFNANDKKRSKLLWMPSEKHLYFRKNIRGGNIEYACYQGILTDRKKRYNAIFVIESFRIF